MDINTLRGIATIFAMVAFIGIVIWAYSSYKKKDFDEAANLPFADEENDEKTAREQHDTRSNDK
ncbi:MULTISPECIES: cbb3-type cytochrome c oxidase subunit 3 [Pseudomonas]|uniref:cbb3-type cytochrome oxidase subunit 3 n=1 Tax=Pseudomonas TaxID=286 RepID=UPI001239E797|nr:MULTISPECIES: cbb3-type cytochrome c oxidase subunit 3 [Pseudomonas]QIB51730.1 cbb3-type cytochrome c oxidase subunit 3 [Pseudomonas sp. OIL-1]QJD57797.1 cbb3-type cytochrome c oxidase subunit 3 [Pseudomonas sp. gcc21]